MGFNEGLVGLQKGLYGVLQGFLGSYRGVSLVSSGFRAVRDWEDDEGFLSKTPKRGFPKIRGTLFRGPYNKDPTI